MALRDYFRVGRIARPQGLKGEIKVQVLSENPRCFDDLAEVALECQGTDQAIRYLPRRVLKSRTAGDAAYLYLDGINSREEVEALRNLYLCIARQDAPPLPENRWYIADLLGCAVLGAAGKEYGVLKDVLQHGAADVYVIAQPGQAGEWMVPAIEALVQQVDIATRRIVLDEEVFAQVAVRNP